MASNKRGRRRLYQILGAYRLQTAEFTRPSPAGATARPERQRYRRRLASRAASARGAPNTTLPGRGAAEQWRQAASRRTPPKHRVTPCRRLIGRRRDACLGELAARRRLGVRFGSAPLLRAARTRVWAAFRGVAGWSARSGGVAAGARVLEARRCSTLKIRGPPGLAYRLLSHLGWEPSSPRYLGPGQVWGRNRPYTRRLSSPSFS